MKQPPSLPRLVLNRLRLLVYLMLATVLLSLALGSCRSVRPVAPLRPLSDINVAQSRPDSLPQLTARQLRRQTRAAGRVQVRLAKQLTKQQIHTNRHETAQKRTQMKEKRTQTTAETAQMKIQADVEKRRSEGLRQLALAEKERAKAEKVKAGGLLGQVSKLILIGCGSLVVVGVGVFVIRRK